MQHLQPLVYGVGLQAYGHNYNNMTYYKILPVQWIRGMADARQITVLISFDDLKTGATFQVGLYDENKNQIATTNVLCTGTDYSGWDGNNKFPVTYSADQLDLTLIKE